MENMNAESMNKALNDLTPEQAILYDDDTSYVIFRLKNKCYASVGIDDGIVRLEILLATFTKWDDSGDLKEPGPNQAELVEKARRVLEHPSRVMISGFTREHYKDIDSIQQKWSE